MDLLCTLQSLLCIFPSHAIAVDVYTQNSRGFGFICGWTMNDYWISRAQ